MREWQTPLYTPFEPTVTAEEAARGVDLTGQVALVTGGSSGLGLETVRVLAASGASISVPATDPIAAHAALKGIGGVEVWPIDLLDHISVKAFAKAFLKRQRRLDLLVLNAGVMARPLFRDEDGREGHFSINYLGHFRLTALLWPALLAVAKSRVVVLSSRAHQMCDLDLDDLDFVRRPYDKWMAYGQSKTANALFAVALDTRGRRHGVSAFSVHPGMIMTPGIRHLTRSEFDAVGAVASDGSPIIDPARDLKTVKQGAATTVWAATAPVLDSIGGVYCENCDVARIEPSEGFGVRPYAIDPEMAERLWRVSARLTGLDIARN
ncbi:SDR family NAD(P)-dependent oxidoreductase [Mesorhizobium helmanticense]|uniref:Oxidoreductase n=1 Tax=Mesorhizobium helmanticense TaxID=1776423 RepID=A0A2T4J377_9HYPH|nr:SDR family NAD(P)-dependent oxidoreductase [Mesorhizobium helmanticense]PTE12366.1 oxidoreductase [Mesorhizobium helmanticense]